MKRDGEKYEVVPGYPSDWIALGVIVSVGTRSVLIYGAIPLPWRSRWTKMLVVCKAVRRGVKRALVTATFLSVLSKKVLIRAESGHPDGQRGGCGYDQRWMARPNFLTRTRH